MYDEPNPSDLKMSMASVVSNPISDRDIYLSESKNFFKIIILSMLMDFLLNELIILNDFILIYYISKKDKETAKTFYFCFFTLVLIIIYGLILFLLNLKKLLISRITRFCYLIIGVLYYIYQIIINLIKLSETNYALDAFYIIAFVIIALSILPKIATFMYIKVYERSIKKIEGERRIVEQQHFLDKIEGKFIKSTSTSSAREDDYEKEIEKNIEEDEEDLFVKKYNNNIKNDDIENDNNENKNEMEEEEEEKKEQENKEVAD